MLINKLVRSLNKVVRLRDLFRREVLSFAFKLFGMEFEGSKGKEIVTNPFGTLYDISQLSSIRSPMVSPSKRLIAYVIDHITKNLFINKYFPD